MRAVAIIPARYASTRLPGKPLLEIAGKFLVQHVYERCLEACRLTTTVIATDDERIVAAARSFGAPVQMTSPDLPSGTDRVAAVAADRDEEIVLNVQGDEPQVAGVDLDRLVAALEADPRAAMATLGEPLTEVDYHSPHAVKVICDLKGIALYFSRSPIPHGLTRFPGALDLSGPAADLNSLPVLKHRGIYAYRREALLTLRGLPPAPLEQLEKLEQLRAMQQGMPIRVVPTLRTGIEINTPEDYSRFLKGATE